MIEFGATKSVSPPFGAVVGQEGMKEALLAVAVEPDLDGLLVRGEKGTAKSTAVRGLVDLLPEQRAVADCPYGCPPGDPGAQCVDCRERADPPVERRQVPLVTLPLGATRERVVGSLSVADALDGDPTFDPGVLARANRGVLYVDEVNLLEDHLVDVLLDAAASGVNRVERDGVSVEHPARFTLVGTMNPEEGELRPQLRDRFALQVTVEGCRDLDDRVAIVDRALDGVPCGNDRDGGEVASVDAEYRERLLRGRELLPEVELPADLKRDVAELCRDGGVEGHRADIATARAARAFAALEGRPTVVEDDLRRAAELALPHRLESRPFEDGPDPEDVIEEHFDGGGTDADDRDEDEADERSPAEDDGDGRETGGDGRETGGDGRYRDGQDADERDGDEGDARERDPDEPGADEGDADGPDGDGRDRGSTPVEAAAGDRDSDEFGDAGGAHGTGDRDRDDGNEGDGNEGDGSEGDGSQGDGTGGGDGDGPENEGVPLVPGQERTGVTEAAAPEVSAPETGTAGSGSRAGARPSPDNEGARIRTERAEAGATGIDPAASVRAAARRGATSDTGTDLRERDLRRSVRSGSGDALVVFALDASASMRPAMQRAKGVVLELLRDAYEQRDAVAVVTFAGESADVVLPPTDSVDLAARHLKDLRTDDRTPLPAGLRTAGEVLSRADPEAAVVVLVTDGRANADTDPTAETRRAARSLGELDPNVVVVDVGDGRGLVPEIVEFTGGERVSLAALTPERVDAAVRGNAAGGTTAGGGGNAGTGRTAGASGPPARGDDSGTG